MDPLDTEVATVDTLIRLELLNVVYPVPPLATELNVPAELTIDAAPDTVAVCVRQLGESDPPGDFSVRLAGTLVGGLPYGDGATYASHAFTLGSFLLPLDASCTSFLPAFKAWTCFGTGGASNPAIKFVTWATVVVGEGVFERVLMEGLFLRERGGGWNETS